MSQSAMANTSRTNLSAAATHEDAYYVLFSTCPSQQAGTAGWRNPATLVWRPPDPWHLRTQGLRSRHPGRAPVLAKTETMHHHVQARTPDHIIWLGLCLVCLNAVGAQQCIGGDYHHLSGLT
jgi:hypothetical protein